VEQKSRGGILLVGIEPLGDGDKPDPLPLKLLDIVQAVHQGAPEAIQFPDQEQSNFLAAASSISRLSPGRLALAPLIMSW
jgi:hypothetical protein